QAREGQRAETVGLPWHRPDPGRLPVTRANAKSSGCHRLEETIYWRRTAIGPGNNQISCSLCGLRILPVRHADISGHAALCAGLLSMVGAHYRSAWGGACPYRVLVRWPGRSARGFLPDVV